jgi:general secretion pathway protein G
MEQTGPAKVRRERRLPEIFGGLVLCLLIAGIVLPRFLAREGGGPSASKSQIASFKSAIELYILDNGRAPTTEQGLEALVRKPLRSPVPKRWLKYLSDVDQIPRDEWGNPFRYQSPGPNGEAYLITSYGADGRPGGMGNDADLSSRVAE